MNMTILRDVSTSDGMTLYHSFVQNVYSNIGTKLPETSLEIGTKNLLAMVRGQKPWMFWMWTLSRSILGK